MELEKDFESDEDTEPDPWCVDHTEQTRFSNIGASNCMALRALKAFLRQFEWILDDFKGFLKAFRRF